MMFVPDFSKSVRKRVHEVKARVRNKEHKSAEIEEEKVQFTPSPEEIASEAALSYPNEGLEETMPVMNDALIQDFELNPEPENEDMTLG